LYRRLFNEEVVHGAVPVVVCTRYVFGTRMDDSGGSKYFMYPVIAW
jgi:hypothetical protein